MKVPAAIPVLLIVTAIGCNRQSHDRMVSLPAQIVIGKAASPGQRFLPTNSGDVAFDTRTGSLCKTWRWRSGGPDDGLGDDRPSRLGQAATCEELYKNDEYFEIRKAAELAKAAKDR